MLQGRSDWPSIWVLGSLRFWEEGLISRGNCPCPQSVYQGMRIGCQSFTSLSGMLEFLCLQVEESSFVNMHSRTGRWTHQDDDDGGEGSIEREIDRLTQWANLIGNSACQRKTKKTMNISRIYWVCSLFPTTTSSCMGMSIACRWKATLSEWFPKRSNTLHLGGGGAFSWPRSMWDIVVVSSSLYLFVAKFATGRIVTSSGLPLDLPCVLSPSCASNSVWSCSLFVTQHIRAISFHCVLIRVRPSVLVSLATEDFPEAPDPPPHHKVQPSISFQLETCFVFVKCENGNHV